MDEQNVVATNEAQATVDQVSTAPQLMTANSTNWVAMAIGFGISFLGGVATTVVAPIAGKAIGNVVKKIFKKDEAVAEVVEDKKEDDQDEEDED